MTTKTTTTTTCDRDHNGAEIPAETRSFAVGGKAYETDLCDPCSVDLDAALAEFIKDARTVSTPKRQRSQGQRTQAHRDRAAGIREWAKREGIGISERGRIPAAVIARYEAK